MNRSVENSSESSSANFSATSSEEAEQLRKQLKETLLKMNSISKEKESHEQRIRILEQELAAANKVRLFSEKFLRIEGSACSWKSIAYWREEISRRCDLTDLRSSKSYFAQPNGRENGNRNKRRR
jgi:hypothetical protein